MRARRQRIKLLEEYKQALIHQVVTGRIDVRTGQPYPAYKDSGVPWLGEIPAHWRAVRLKFLSTEPLAYGANESASEDDPSYPRFVRITDIHEDGSLRAETFRSLPPETAAPYVLEDGDILFARSGATVGKVFIYKSSWGAACFAGYLIRLRCNPRLVHAEFVYNYAQTEVYWGQVREGTIQATIQNFSAEKYGDLAIGVPPIEEQRAIVDYIARETAKIDAAIAADRRSIELLQEFRTRLIADVVTGKLDVREAAA
ncbi:MAG: restriction endonuclease subunit S, partial [Armatimonadota bacterium]